MELHGTLAEGSTAKIKRITYNKKTCAIKIIPKNQRNIQDIQKEIKIHSSLNHPNIVSYIIHYSDAVNFNIIMDYIPYNLRSLIIPDIGMDPILIHMIFVQLISAVKYLHSRRDIKPENILICKNGNVKIADFGYSTLFYYKGYRRLKSFAGSFEYIAPEVYNKDYDGPLCDIWSCGITLINMLTGKLPWNMAYNDEGYQEYRLKNVLEILKGIREQIVKLIEGMLRIEKYRYRIDDICTEPWFLQKNNLLDETFNCTDPSYLENIKETKIELYFTQPNEIRTNKCFINSSLPIQKNNLPETYRIYVIGQKEEISKIIQNILDRMGIKYDGKDNYIIFSTIDGNRNTLNGEICIQEALKECFVTIRRTRGDLLEFKKLAMSLEGIFK